MHVINVDIQDNHEEATLGAFLICELCQCVSIGPWAGLRRAHRGFSMNVTSTPLGSRSAYCQTLKPINAEVPTGESHRVSSG